MQTYPAIAIFILNWNGKDDTLACLASLQKLNYPNYTVIVIDNASQDDSVHVIRESFPAVTLFEMPENLGFVGGNNYGLRHAEQNKFEYALLLNNDTEISSDFLRLLVETAESDSTIGIVSPLIYYFEQKDTMWSAGGKIDWSHGSTSMIGIGEVDKGQFGEKPYSVDFVTGCALLIKMEVVAQVGMLDERFFAYYEDAEWCLRVQKAGFRTMLVPHAKIWHKISPVVRESSPHVHYLMTRNRLLFLEVTNMHKSAWQHTIFEYGRTLFSWTVKPKWRHKKPQRQAMLQAIKDYRNRRFGGLKKQSITKRIYPISSNKMHILVISRWYPYPADNGSKIRVFNLIKYFAKRHHIVLVSFAGESINEERQQAMRQYCQRVIVVPYQPFHIKASLDAPANWKAWLGFFSSKPRSVINTYSQEMVDSILTESQRTKFDLVVASEIDSIPYGLLLPDIPKHLDELQIAIHYGRFINASNVKRKIRAWLTWWKTARYVAKSLQKYDGCSVASSKERDLILKISHNICPIEVIPNGVDTELWAINESDSRTFDANYEFVTPDLEPDTLIYSGSLTFYANFDAVDFFIQHVLPLIQVKHPHVKFFITGKTNDEIRNRLPQNDAVNFTGYLNFEELRNRMATSWLSVVPLQEGGGTRLKILESLAVGTPVVSTHKGAEGINIIDGKHVLLSDSPTDFAKAVIRLLEDKKLRNELGFEGNRLVRNQYDWNIIAHKLGTFLKSIV